MFFNELPPKLLSVVEYLDLNFWEEWKEMTSNFPDTEDVSTWKFISVQAAIISIVANYLSGFDKENRVKYLELLISNLRTIEIALRDVKEEDL